MKTRHSLPLIGDGRADDTPAIQQRLDSRASAVYLPPPETAYRISHPLRIYSHQSLVLDRFTRIQLAPGSNCLMLCNHDPEEGNEQVAVRGGIWDMDNLHQSPNPFALPGGPLQHQRQYQPEIYLGIGMRFDNLRGLSLQGLTFKNPVTFCVQIARAQEFSVDDIRFDFNLGNPIPGNMDGIHLDGGCRFGRITNLKGTTYDDLLALNADDGIDSPCFGPIEDIQVDGIFAEGAHSAVRMLSNHSWVRRVSIANVYGSFYQYGIGITNIYPHADEPSDGLFDDISIREMHACKAERRSIFQKDDHPVFPMVWVERGARLGSLSIHGMHRRESCTGVECVGVAQGASVGRLHLSDCSYHNQTGVKAAFLGNEGEIGELNIGSVQAGKEAVLDNRGQVGRLVWDGEQISPVPYEPPPAKARWKY